MWSSSMVVGMVNDDPLVDDDLFLKVYEGLEKVVSKNISSFSAYQCIYIYIYIYTISKLVT